MIEFKRFRVHHSAPTLALVGLLLVCTSAASAMALHSWTTATTRGRAVMVEPVAAERGDMQRVIVNLKGLQAGQEWAGRIEAARSRVMAALAGHKVEVNRTYDLIPALALTVDSRALAVLRTHPDVASIAEDGLGRPQGTGSGGALGGAR